MFTVGLVVYIRTKQQCGFVPFQYLFCIMFEPQHEISNNAVCANNKDSEQPAHTHSLSRAFASRLIILKGDCTGSPESIHVKMPHFWKSHVAAYICSCLFTCLSLVAMNIINLILARPDDISSRSLAIVADSQHSRTHLSPFARCTLGLSRPSTAIFFY